VKTIEGELRVFLSTQNEPGLRNGREMVAVVLATPWTNNRGVMEEHNGNYHDGGGAGV